MIVLKKKGNYILGMKNESKPIIMGLKEYKINERYIYIYLTGCTCIPRAST